ncbi:hypothetical protein [Horticoccus sp. 23ND18S-11]|uniref:hypothetical protein n=1 Tax=Horticoccus sp. 23ND18S-11 TaxID=3391832 RepID=UPI0039C973F2
MSLLDAVIAAGIIPDDIAPRETKKAYAETLSRKLAEELAAGLREVGFSNMKPFPGEPGEKEFHGGLGSKKVDVSYSDEQHGLIFAVSVKSICFAPFGKNLKNRFGDLCTEAIGLHMRFPYATVCMLFAFPEASDADHTPRRTRSTFRRAARLLATVSGREDYTDAGEKFELVTLLRFKPLTAAGLPPEVSLIDAKTEAIISEKEYFVRLLELHDIRNPHAPIAEGLDE